jgi:hypothetical protein
VATKVAFLVGGCQLGSGIVLWLRSRSAGWTSSSQSGRTSPTPPFRPSPCSSSTRGRGRPAGRTACSSSTPGLSLVRSTALIENSHPSSISSSPTSYVSTEARNLSSLGLRRHTRGSVYGSCLRRRIRSLQGRHNRSRATDGGAAGPLRGQLLGAVNPVEPHPRVP